MPPDKKQQDKIFKLLKQSGGTLNKVLDMIESDVYCFDIIQQIHSINGTNKKAVELLLENHLGTCVQEQMKGSKTASEQAIQEIMKIYKSK